MYRIYISTFLEFGRIPTIILSISWGRPKQSQRARTKRTSFHSSFSAISSDQDALPARSPPDLPQAFQPSSFRPSRSDWQRAQLLSAPSFRLGPCWPLYLSPCNHLMKRSVQRILESHSLHEVHVSDLTYLDSSGGWPGGSRS